MENTMNRCTAFALSAMALVYMASFAAVAQNAPPSYQGDPDVYKVIFEDQNFRVIAATRKKGVHDKVHGHPVPSVIYFVDDCTTKQYAADGKTAEATVKAGTAFAVPITASHSAENTGPADCHQIFVERK
jgi:mannose-6-phosphate isomerase-like protein (cupin superfamily)